MTIKRGLLSTVRGIVQLIAPAPAVDEFGELPARKRNARAAAEHLGHELTAWRRRKNDQYGRWNAYCEHCGMTAVVGLEPAPGIGETSYGPALTESCRFY